MIRVSKQYLPNMSRLLSDPKVVVFVGDGFKFLAENTSSYDVIITDSSDPVGPAASLFQKPYFQLLHDALTPGGHISTQAECLWLHVPLIKELKQSTGQLFTVAEYAFTTIPTYPSGQIGFMVCAKGEKRDLQTPVRKVPNTIYYNENVHKAAFVLPEFARSLFEDDKKVGPIFGRGALEIASANKQKKKILLLGSGFVARPAAEYLTRRPENYLTVACRTLEKAQKLAEGLTNSTAISLDVNAADALEAAVADHDLVISLIPYTYHPNVIKAAIKGKTHVVTTSYVSPSMVELDEEVKKAGIVVMNEIGLDPGIDHLYAIKTIDEVHAKGGKVSPYFSVCRSDSGSRDPQIKQFLSYCGGLPAPECSGNPLGYKFSWSSRGVLLALLNSASYIHGGKQLDITSSELMGVAKPYFISPAYAFVAYPNRNSVTFREWYNIPEAETVVRGTLRYQGFPEFIKALVDLGWLDATVKEWLTDNLTWAEVTQKAIGASSASETYVTETGVRRSETKKKTPSDLIARIKEVAKFPDDLEASRIISGFRWIGFFSSEKVQPRAGNLLDTLCARLEGLMKYETGERDLVMLQHKFVVEWQDGKTVRLVPICSSLARRC